MSKVNRSIGNLVMCLAEVVIGILLLINPIGFTSGIIVAAGVVLTVMGIGSIMNYFRTAAEEAALESNLAKGLILSCLRIFCMFRSNWFIVTFPLLTVLYGIVTLITGISKVQWAVDMLRTKQKYWFIEVIGAVLSFIFAVLILTNPFASTAILWHFIAITLLVEAVVDIAAFILGRKS